MHTLRPLLRLEAVYSSSGSSSGSSSSVCTRQGEAGWKQSRFGVNIQEFYQYLKGGDVGGVRGRWRIFPGLSGRRFGRPVRLQGFHREQVHLVLRTRKRKNRYIQYTAKHATARGGREGGTMPHGQPDGKLSYRQHMSG